MVSIEPEPRLCRGCATITQVMRTRPVWVCMKCGAMNEDPHILKRNAEEIEREKNKEELEDDIDSRLS